MDADTKNRHDRRRMRTKTKLQDALLALMLEKGFDAIVVQEITDLADVGRGTFYFHFNDKEDVLWSLVEERIRLTEQDALGQFSGEMPEQPEFYGYVNTFRHMAFHKDTYRAILGANGSLQIASRVKDCIAAETVKHMERFGVYGEIGQPPEVTAQIVAGMVLSLAIWWLETPNDYSALYMGEIVYRTLHHREPPVGTWHFSGAN